MICNILHNIKPILYYVLYLLLNKSQSRISLVVFVAILFTIGFVPYLTQEAFAAFSPLTSAIANDPDDGDAVYSVGDTIVITFPVAVNGSFASGTMDNNEFRANFTFSASDIDDNDIVSGVWNAGSTALTITIDTILGTIFPVIDTETISYDTGNGNIGYGTNSTHFAGSSATLTGDFGLFVAVTTTSGGGSGCTDCTSPTLGVLDNGKRIVDDGFSYNGKSVDVEYYFTPYPLVTVKVGKQNVAEFKIYENLGVDNIRHFELAFGLASGESIGMSNAVINWDKTFDGIETVTIDDPENVLDKVKVSTSEGYCNDGMQTKCLIVKVVHTFRAPLDFDILGTNVWDAKRNTWNNYFNHGIEVVGESLNPPKEYEATDKRQLYHLTETGKTTAVDEFGNSWSLEYGLWTKDYVKAERIQDTSSVMTRMHSDFIEYKKTQADLASNMMPAYYRTSINYEESFSEINDIFAYDYPEIINSLDNPVIQKNMVIQTEKAQKIMNYLLNPLLDRYQ